MKAGERMRVQTQAEHEYLIMCYGAGRWRRALAGVRGNGSMNARLEAFRAGWAACAKAAAESVRSLNGGGR